MNACRKFLEFSESLMNALLLNWLTNFLPMSVTGVTVMSNRASKSKTKEVIRRYRSNAKLLGPRPLLVREDAVAYDALFAIFRAAVKPVDIFDEMFVADMVSLQ